jgi:hypothetical protein
MIIAFDTGANLNYTDPNPVEYGGTADYTFIPNQNGTNVDLILTNTTGASYCVIVLSCRLLKRYAF